MTVDESARHAITKLANLHFAATKESALRIRAMGEENGRIHVVGAPALDVLYRAKLPSRLIDEPLILLTLHPIGAVSTEAAQQMTSVLAAAAIGHAGGVHGWRCASSAPRTDSGPATSPACGTEPSPPARARIRNRAAMSAGMRRPRRSGCLASI